MTPTDPHGPAAAGPEAAVPSGKGADDENFPVGSLLIDARLRPTVRAFYAVARAADDVADDPGLAPQDKLLRLGAFRQALEGRTDAPAVAARARRALTAAGVPVAHALRLLDAFERDAVTGRCDGWDDLMGYCAASAAPVGRFLLDLHGEDAACVPASDALCAALQVINHLQDCRDDYRSLDRVYLPADWLAAEAATVDQLAADAAGPGLRRVLDRCLDRVDGLLAAARSLPLALRSTRLALEAAAILRLAEVLSAALKTRDPLAGPVRLSRPAMLWHGGAAAALCLLRRLAGRRRPA
ncbi:squalene/phytoene synthase family protein [Thalassobaculum sp.]|uniref:squalene/phytoene synthase family protein n=1 Tax=Thalassobaculum sp. TaxID=2022740 RepID=UPI0032ECA948